MQIILADISYFWNLKGKFKQCTPVIELFKNIRKKSFCQRITQIISKCDKPTIKKKKLTLSSVLEVISAMMERTSNELIYSIPLNYNMVLRIVNEMKKI